MPFINNTRYFALSHTYFQGGNSMAALANEVKVSAENETLKKDLIAAHEKANKTLEAAHDAEKAFKQVDALIDKSMKLGAETMAMIEASKKQAHDQKTKEEIATVERLSTACHFVGQTAKDLICVILKSVKNGIAVGDMANEQLVVAIHMAKPEYKPTAVVSELAQARASVSTGKESLKDMLIAAHKKANETLSVAADAMNALEAANKILALSRTLGAETIEMILESMNKAKGELKAKLGEVANLSNACRMIGVSVQASTDNLSDTVTNGIAVGQTANQELLKIIQQLDPNYKSEGPVLAFSKAGRGAKDATVAPAPEPAKKDDAGWGCVVC